MNRGFEYIILKVILFQLQQERLSPLPGSWTHAVSRGGLHRGPNQMVDWVIKCDKGFNEYHKQGLVTGRSIHKRTCRYIQMLEDCGDIPEKVMKLFVKVMIFMK